MRRLAVVQVLQLLQLLIQFFKNSQSEMEVNIQTKGGNLSVSYLFQNNIYIQVFLKGPATLVFEGEIEI